MPFHLDLMRLHDEAAPHRGGQMLLRASLHRCSRTAGCWCQGVQTPEGGAQHPQCHHEARKGKGRNIIIFMLSLEENNMLQRHVNAHRRDPTICHEKALKFYDFFVNKLSFEALRSASFQFLSSRLIIL